MNVVGCKWVFKVKATIDGSLERYKAKLVVKGFHQQLARYYGDTFSPVVRPAPYELFYPLLYPNPGPSCNSTLRMLFTLEIYMR